MQSVIDTVLKWFGLQRIPAKRCVTAADIVAALPLFPPVSKRAYQKRYYEQNKAKAAKYAKAAYRRKMRSKKISAAMKARWSTLSPEQRRIAVDKRFHRGVFASVANNGAK